MPLDFPDIQQGTKFGETFARQWRNVMDVVARVDNLTVSHPLALSTSQGSMRLEILDQPPDTVPSSLDVQRFTIVNRDKDGERIVDSTHGDNLDDGQTRDYLTCQPFDIAQSINFKKPSDIVKATKGVVKIWKPFGLRWIDYRNYIRVLKFDRIVKFTRVDEHTRIASFVDKPLLPTEEQVITPAYQPGIEIIAIKRSPLLTFPANNRIEDKSIEWMELNDGRWWANAFLGEIGGS